ncbi:putative acyl-protein thioesterase-1 [Gongronella butleri]|nr:putative acyl-protein thioesterase-1 [Gongronella butleri]
MSTLQVVTVPPTAAHEATVIWLHGLGDSGAGWYFLAEHLGPQFPGIRWLFPNAPLRALAANDMSMTPAWFNVAGFDKASGMQQVDEQGMLESVATIDKIIQQELATGAKVILGGFSQGCVITLLTAVSTKERLAGVIGASGWLALGEKATQQMMTDVSKAAPFLICHGDEDPVVKHRWGRASARYLAKIGYNVEFKEYTGLAHAVNQEEVDDIAQFIRKQLSDAKL